MLVQLFPLSQYGCSFQQRWSWDKSHYTIIRDSSQGVIVGLWRDHSRQCFLCTVCLSYYISCSSLLHFLPSQTYKYTSSSWVVSHLCCPTLRSHNCLLSFLIIWLKFVSEVNQLKIRLRRRSWEFKHSLKDIVKNINKNEILPYLQ